MPPSPVPGLFVPGALPCATARGTGVFGIISSIPVLSSRSPSGPAGGAPDGYGLTSGWGGELLDRAVLRRPGGAGRSYIGRTGPGDAARGYSESLASLLRHLNRLGHGLIGGPDPVRYG